MHDYRIHPIAEHVRANLAAADPYYRGAQRTASPVDEETHGLDFAKTARDLGRLEPDTMERLLRLADRTPIR